VSRRYRIAVDVDGVLADFVEGLRDFVERRTGKRPTTHPDEWDHLRSWGYPVSWADVNAHASEVCSSLAWYPGAQEMLRRLCRDHEVAFTTTPMNVAWLGARAAWLESYGFELRQHVHVTDKAWVHCDYMLDDGVHNLIALRHGQPLCIARPWNASCPVSIPRIGLQDVFDYLP
jgi:5'(3')-deoxyribonucleotidase